MGLQYQQLRGPDANGIYYCDGPGNGTGNQNGPLPAGHLGCPTAANDPIGCGNISNNPHIEFDSLYNFDNNSADVTVCIANTSCSTTPNKILGSCPANFCNSRVYLCAIVGYNNPASASGSPANNGFALDSVEFDIFQYSATSNPLDPTSAPPLRTFFIPNPGYVPAGPTDPLVTNTLPASGTCTATGIGRNPGCGYCVLWDGSFNILGGFGKSNGQFGFRATVATNQSNGTVGNVNITNTAAYPFGPTQDSGLSQPVPQMPITVDVTDVHVVRSTPTVVGLVTGVAAEPYNITYRLAKDATTFITISNPGAAGSPTVRSLVPGLPRPGEGTPLGTLQNGDSWNGRADNGDLMPPGVYLATLQAQAENGYAFDLSSPTTIQISLDPLQITDIAVQPLTSLSTSLAVLTYVLTEPATTYVDIYPPGTQFCPVGSDVSPINNVYDTNLDRLGISPKNFNATMGPCGGGGTAVLPIRTFFQVQTQRTPQTTFWDGTDANSNELSDGDYVFLLYASLPSQNGYQFLAPSTDKRIWTSIAKSGFITIARGNVTISQLTPSSTVIGSSPPVAGLNPFTFSYSMSREAYVTLNILNSNGSIVRTLVNNQTRPGNFVNSEVWTDGTDNNGLAISSGVYTAQLSVADPIFPGKVSTTTVFFPLNLYRITDVSLTPLLNLATSQATLSYQLSQSMFVSWNIYTPGTRIQTSSWPPCGALIPGVCAQTTSPQGTSVAPFITVNGMRPGRQRITEFWDGRDTNGLFVPDGSYPYTLVAQSSTTPKYFATDYSDGEMGLITVARGIPVFTTFNVIPTIPALFNSSQTIALPPYDFSYSITRQSSVTISILTTNIPPSIIRTVIAGQARDGGILNQDFWDGRDANGNFVPNGFYTVQATAYDLASALSSGSTVQQTISVDPLRIYDVAVTPLVHGGGAAIISYQVSEPMKTSLKIYQPGTTIDQNGNATPPDPVSLVRFFTGVEPARTLINQQWDGRNFQLALVPDGDYIFRLVGSTATAEISGLTANVLPGAALADDLITADVSVSRGSSTDPEGDFENNTFVYPNPVSGSQATFNIWVPFQSDVSVKLYTLAGMLVYQNFFANQPDSYDNGPLSFSWNRVNSSNRRLAAGVYFLLVREQDSKGGTNILQTVKKILLQ